MPAPHLNEFHGANGYDWAYSFSPVDKLLPAFFFITLTGLRQLLDDFLTKKLTPEQVEDRARLLIRNASAEGDFSFTLTAAMEELTIKKIVRFILSGTISEDDDHTFQRPVLDLISLDSSRKIDDITEVEAGVQSITWLMEQCFPNEQPDWLVSIANSIEEILSTIANLLLKDKIKDGNYQKFAELSGSMARALFGEQPCRMAAAKLLEEVYNNLHSQVSPVVASTLKRLETSVYDMDVKIPQDFSFEELFRLLQNLSGSWSLPARVEYIHIKNVEVIIVTLSPSKGRSFSIDITRVPQSEDEYKRDYRLGTHLSRKRNVSVDLVAATDPVATTTRIAVASGLGKLVANLVEIGLPSRVENTEYVSFDQAIYAALSLIRLELFSPANWIFGERKIEIETEKKLFFANLLHILYKVRKISVEAFRREEIIREGLVLLCADKHKSIVLIREIGLDRVLGIEEELDQLEEMSTEVFFHKITTDHQFLEFCAKLFDVTLVNSPKLVASKSTNEARLPPTPQEAYAMMDTMSAGVSKSIFSWREYMAGGELDDRSYMPWVIEYGADGLPKGFSLASQLRLERKVTHAEMQAEVFLLIEKGSSELSRLSRIADRSLQKNMLMKSILNTTIAEVLNSVYARLFYDRGLQGEMLGVIRVRRRQNPFLDFSREQMPLAIYRLYVDSLGQKFAVLTHAVSLNPRLVLHYLQRTIDHQASSIMNISLLKNHIGHLGRQKPLGDNIIYL